jgi:hypothetical protein
MKPEHLRRRHAGTVTEDPAQRLPRAPQSGIHLVFGQAERLGRVRFAHPLNVAQNENLAQAVRQAVDPPFEKVPPLR